MCTQMMNKVVDKENLKKGGNQPSEVKIRCRCKILVVSEDCQSWTLTSKLNAGSLQKISPMESNKVLEDLNDYYGTVNSGGRIIMRCFSE